MLSYFLFSTEKLVSEDAAALLSSADYIYISCIPLLTGGIRSFGDALRRFGDLCRKGPQGRRPKILLSTPFISRGRMFARFCHEFASFAPLFDGFLLQNAGDVELIRTLTASSFGAAFEGPSGERFIIAGDTAFNVTNRVSAEYRSGVLDVLAILPELSKEDQFSLARAFPENVIPEITVFSAAIVSRSEHCIAAVKDFHCGRCGSCGLSAGYLRDERGRRFGIVTDPEDCSSLLLGIPQEESFAESPFAADPAFRRSFFDGNGSPASPGVPGTIEKLPGDLAEKAVFRVYEGL